ncbi:tyrosine-type recombinase/integrase [Desulfotignum balticum]|uniref:tyrosine-type recombinase/integrase n=1 Tax=Desulfotignum balticum TaxID=115781 RepID=UPI000417B5A7|nr:site-specific integrase [Desulfotignum balticum]
MAINIHCMECKSDLKLGSKVCSNCGAKVPKNKKYRVIVRVNGKRVSRIAGNLVLARDIESKLKTDISRDEFDIQKKKPAMTLNEFWEEKYLSWLKVNKKSWKIDQYNFNKNLSPALGKQTLDAISPFDIEKFVLLLKKRKSRQGKPLSASYIKHQLVLLTRIFNVASQWGIFTGQNPCNKVKKPRLNNQIVEFLSADELTRLINTLDTWTDRMQASIVSFSFYTGMRPSEIFKLEWRDIDFENATITLRDPKGTLDQILPLSGKAIEVLRSVPKEFDTPFVFYSSKGKQRKTIRHGWQKIKEAAGIHESFRYYDFRHNFASYLVSSGVSLYQVQKLLTHKDSSTTMRYAHLSDKSLRDTVNRSDELLAPSKGKDTTTTKRA